MQILTPQPVADALEEGHGYLPDRAVSDVDDPDLGAAAMEEDDATGGGGGAGGSGGGVALMNVQTTTGRRSSRAAHLAPTRRARVPQLRQPHQAARGRTAEGSTNARRVDLRAELLAATERNAQEVCKERERAEKDKVDAAKSTQEKADAAAKAQADAAARAQADATAKVQAEEAAHG
nr:tol-Pal system protein TolA-like [Aegilops tauschii subsp. strangulata]